MSVDERARAGLFLAMQYPVEVPGVSVVELPAHRQDRRSTARRPSCAPGSRTSRRPWSDLAHGPGLRRAQRQRGLLRRREEAPRDPPAGAAQAEDRHPRRDRLRPRRRRAAGSSPRASTASKRDHGDGRPAHHALHADPALHQARLRPRVRRRPDRRGGRPRAGRPARGRGLRPFAQPTPGRRPDERRDPLHRARTLARLRADFPILSRTVRGRAPAGLPRLRGHLAEAARACSTRWRPLLRAHNADVHRGAHQLAEEAHRRPSRPPATTIAAVHRGAARDEVVFTKNATEAINLVAYAFTNGAHGGVAAPATGSRWGRATRSSSPRWSTTPTSSRGRSLHERTGATLRWFGLTDDGRLDLDRSRRPDHRADEGRRVHPRVQRARHDQPGRRDRRDGPTRSARWSCSTRASRCRTCRSTSPTLGRRLPGLLRPQDARPAPASACSGAGASCSSRCPPFLAGGEMIETVTMEGADVRRRSRTSSRPGRPPIGEAVGLGAACDYLSALGMDRVHAHEQALTERLLRGLAERSWVRVLGPADLRDRGGAVAFDVDGVHPTTSGRCSTTGASRCGSATTARGRCTCAAGRCQHPRELRRLHARPVRSTRSSRRSTGCRPYFGVEVTGPDGPVPGDHPRPLQEPACGRGCASRSRPRATTSTRRAATR